jgi:integrase
MASFRRRGPRNARKWYVRFETGRVVDDKRPQTDRLLKGVVNDYQATQELARVERELAAGRDPFPGPAVVPAAVKPLMENWRDSLTNRSAADDRSRIDRHLIPKFKTATLDEITLPAVIKWIRDLKKGDLSPQTQRHLVNLLSRFFSWAIGGGLATVNPVKMVPQGVRPIAAQDSDEARPWLEDEGKVSELVGQLGGDVGKMFYLANRSGLRLGEVCGLRLSDLEFLHEGVIRVAHSYDGPLKEAKPGGKTTKVGAGSERRRRDHRHPRQDPEAPGRQAR